MIKTLLRSPAYVELRWLDRSEARGSYDNQGVTHAQWQAVLDRQSKEKEEQLSKRKEDEEKITAEAKEERLNKARFFSLDDSVVASDAFKGKQLKVIVKVGLPYARVDLLKPSDLIDLFIRLLRTISSLVSATKGRGT